MNSNLSFSRKIGELSSTYFHWAITSIQILLHDNLNVWYSSYLAIYCIAQHMFIDLATIRLLSCNFLLAQPGPMSRLLRSGLKPLKTSIYFAWLSDLMKYILSWGSFFFSSSSRLGAMYHSDHHHEQQVLFMDKEGRLCTCLTSRAPLSRSSVSGPLLSMEKRVNCEHLPAATMAYASSALPVQGARVGQTSHMDGLTSRNDCSPAQVGVMICECNVL